MNKDKAIQLLERLQDPEPYEPMLTKDAYDAIQMAIDALSADGDTISRKAAIDALSELATFTDECSKHTWMYTDDVYKAIKQLPPAQPERIKGHWVNGHCDKCNEHAPFWAMASTYYASNFCPNCGADMRATVPDIDDVTCENCYYSERFVDGLILCRRTKTSHRVSATSTCGKGKREAAA